ncbi:MAG: 1,6-anhydro-N-acetylmuramyl-L-alanine amidase AmpD [Gammaproteobacteria bacterium]|nr:1,6-anhydro-N-acetylmuramyl-L-alanine amidase AmpD [Gammaproteobacteria bacterium]MBU1624721.1 1,6-anhydro-N-acetylmuramyl-L-alanine amidase AmpD [Gammaproteobacteria bacterium]MBU1982565.1 1,6-anhydro-N-acetylmuramyl-L-alanine amidase AmpD [Gammaproteobacteria bacterium]
MKFDANGWLSGVRRVASPNYDARPARTAVSLLVIHSISLPPDEFSGPGIRQLFTNTLDCSAHPYYARLEGVRVSAHFLIARDGGVTQFVACGSRAWHAGVSIWQGRERCNDFSIGIELEGCDSQPFESVQYVALARLTRRLQRQYPIRHITGHADIAPGRKTDPGLTFDWKQYFSLLDRSSA